MGAENRSLLDHVVSDLRNDAPEDVDLGRVWISVAAQVWRRQPGWLERTAGRLLRSPGLARALLTTPSLLLPWLLTSVAVLAAGAAATTDSGQPLVALLAPAVAAAAIAYCYGPGIDPAWELSCSMAISDRMVGFASVILGYFLVGGGMFHAPRLM